MLIYGQSDKLSHKALDFKSEPASVSIGAKPVSSFAIHRSSAVPIALKRPIRKVSFGDMSDFESSTSGIKSVPQLNATSPFRSSSSASPRSYTLRDAVYNRVPASPAYSQHSEVADSEDSKVRGGRLYESDCNSSSASLSSHTSREDIQASSSTGTHSQHQARPLHSSPPEPTATSSADAKPKPNAAACLPDLHKLHIESQPAQGDTVSSSKSGNQENSLRGSSSMDAFSNNGHKTHGGNLFGSQGDCTWL